MTRGGRSKKAKRSRSAAYSLRPNPPPRVKGTPDPHSRGSALRVWNGSVHHTDGGLTRAGLMKNRFGRVVSRAKHLIGKRLYRANPSILDDNRHVLR